MRSLVFAFSVLIALLSLPGCEECEECENVATAPITTLAFRNETLSEEISPVIDMLSDQVRALDSVLAIVNVEITSLQTGIDTLEQQILGRAD